MRRMGKGELQCIRTYTAHLAHLPGMSSLGIPNRRKYKKIVLSKMTALSIFKLI